MMELPDEVLVAWLRERGFSDVGARKALKSFRESMFFARLDSRSAYHAREEAWHDAIKNGPQ
jgi:hypothetical protein